MTNHAQTPTTPGAHDIPVQPPRRQRLQIGLRTLLLVTAASAVWIAHFNNRSRIATLETRIRALRPLVRELAIVDLTKTAVVQLEPLWFDENQWDVYLPAGRYRLCLATRTIDKEGLAPASKTTLLAAGTHRFALEQKKSRDGVRISVTCDSIEILAADETADWDPRIGSEGSGQFSTCQQLAPADPLVLFRRRFMQRIDKTSSRVPNHPTEGLLLWIESDS